MKKIGVIVISGKTVGVGALKRLWEAKMTAWRGE